LVTKDVDKSIIEALIPGYQTYNKLWNLVKPVCSSKTFDNHLKILVSKGKIKRRENGQYVEYYLIDNKEIFDSKLSQFVEMLNHDAINEYPKVIRYFKKFQKLKYSKIKHEDQIKIFFQGLDSVNLILRWHQLLLLIIIGRFVTSDTNQKAKELQKKYNQQLQELFQVFRRMDPSLSRTIFSNVFEDLYPRKYRP